MSCRMLACWSLPLLSRFSTHHGRTSLSAPPWPSCFCGHQCGSWPTRLRSSAPPNVRFPPVANTSRLARTFAAELSVRAAFGTTCQALRQLLLFQEVVHHVGHCLSVSEPHRLPVT